jgi:hypothetical protein
MRISVTAGRARFTFACAARANPFLNLNVRNISPETKNGHQNRRKSLPRLERVMSETSADTQAKSHAARGDAADQRAFAQVEKWMAIIREISRERQGSAFFRG